MKKAELEKLKGKKIAGGGFGSAQRFGKDAAAVHDKREQRERDRQQGLVPFACKLHEDLVRRIHEAAQARGMGLNEIAAELISKGLEAKAKAK
jgi:ribosome-binding protein aMBF1 (putative translation factor)